MELTEPTELTRLLLHLFLQRLHCQCGAEFPHMLRQRVARRVRKDAACRVWVVIAKD